MCAISRTICCILENYQTDEGIVIPPNLRPYFPEGMEFIKFVKPAPIDEKPEAKKQKGKKKKGENSKSGSACLEAELKDLSVQK